ncbi:hypothetical protein LH51_05840 [Nitrincola sp. A-D6]|uniref:hypothetical protein n=1 Tax=Nitrincola sp. A-D6 TaxID=1545442 RepID=UPI00051F9DED|nr:hypothetical protein [Nitrincola sp. A-D6]KGK42581.1 hypothetical protein LH51_05840 [Nitrincola sp. A-D6]
MQPKRQLLHKYIGSLMLLLLVIAMFPANLVAASPLATEHHQVTAHPCDAQYSSTQFSESTQPDSGTLVTDICQGEGCLQCSTCAAVNLTISSTDEPPLAWKQYYLSHQGSETTQRLERPPKS